MFGRSGKPAKRPTIDAVRELTAEDWAGLRRATNSNPVKRHRDSHHLVARLFAMGLKPGEVAAETGYSLGRISTLSADPAFEELTAFYRSVELDSFAGARDEYYESVSGNRRMAARMINDKLCETAPEDISFRELVLIHSDAADRTGYPKRTVAFNVNTDFAALLDKAIQRSQSGVAPPTTLIESAAEPPSPPLGDGGDQVDVSPGPQSLRRVG